MKRKPGVQVACDICGQLVYQRGLKSHIRLLHNLKLTEVTKVTSSPTQITTQIVGKSKKKLTNVITSVTTQVIEKKKEYSGIDWGNIGCKCKDCGISTFYLNIDKQGNCQNCRKCVNCEKHTANDDLDGYGECIDCRALRRAGGMTALSQRNKKVYRGGIMEFMPQIHGVERKSKNEQYYQYQNNGGTMTMKEWEADSRYDLYLAGFK